MGSITLSIIISFLPVFLWYLIIKRDNNVAITFFFWTVFSLTMIFAFVWKIYGEDVLMNYFKFKLDIIYIFLIIGVLIEYNKNLLVRFIGKNFFSSLNDVVDLSFATALGFTAMENIIVFYFLFSGDFEYGASIEIIKNILTQILFILPVHLVASGVFGYYYGLSLFALPEERKYLGKIYPYIQIFKGTIFSVVPYAIFFYLKEKDFTVHDLILIFGYDVPLYEQLLPIISFLFFSVGTLFLFHKLDGHIFITETKDERIKRLAEKK